MSNFELYSYGSSDCSDLINYSPNGDFFISIEFDLKKKTEEGLLTFYFFLCTKKGFENQKYSDELKFIEFVDEYSFIYVKKYLEENIVKKTLEMDDKELISYMMSNFIFENE